VTPFEVLNRAKVLLKLGVLGHDIEFVTAMVRKFDVLHRLNDEELVRLRQIVADNE
jgi:hypothetical protein